MAPQLAPLWGALSGYIATGTIQGAVIGAFTGAVLGGIGAPAADGGGSPWARLGKNALGTLRGLAQRRAMDDDHVQERQGQVTQINTIGGTASPTITNSANGAAAESFSWTMGGVLDRGQTALDFAGLAPGVGIFPDALNVVVSVFRGDFGNAVLSAGAMIPIAGQGIIGAKFVAKGAGPYKSVKGHHVHAKAAFKDHMSYNNKDGFSISQSFMKENGLDHAAMTRYQRQAFKELSQSGRANSLKEHTQIAVDALMAGGSSREMARSLTAKSLNTLRNSGVRTPTNIPWYK